MRTTVDIDDDVLSAAKEIARRTASTAGRVLSDLARRALTEGAPRRKGKATAPFLGFKPLPADGRVLTNADLDRIRDEEGV